MAPRISLLLFIAVILISIFTSPATSNPITSTTKPATSPTTFDPAIQNDIGSDYNGGKNQYDVVADDKPEEDDDDDVQDEDLHPRFSLETFITIVVTLMIVVSNCTIVMVAAWTEAFNNFNKIFMYSMTLADLLVGLFVTPYSIFLSVYRRWVFAGDTFCNIEAYFLMCLSGAKLFSLTWLNVDHYIAVRKPERYNMMMSQTRSLCWVFFCWLAPISFCIPPVVSIDPSVFNKAVYVCQANTHAQVAYMATAGALVSLPAFIALIVTNVYIFTRSYKKRILFYEKVFVELSTRPWKYQMTFVMCTVLFFLWLPYLLMFVFEEVVQDHVHGKIQFYFFWLGLISSSTNFFVLMAMCSDFRQAVLDLYRFSDWCPLCQSCRRVGRYAYDSDVNVITIHKK